MFLVVILESIAIFRILCIHSQQCNTLYHTLVGHPCAANKLNFQIYLATAHGYIFVERIFMFVPGLAFWSRGSGFSNSRMQISCVSVCELYFGWTSFLLAINGGCWKICENCMYDRKNGFGLHHGKSEPTSLLPYPITTSISFEEQQCAAVMTWFQPMMVPPQVLRATRTSQG